MEGSFTEKKGMTIIVNEITTIKDFKKFQKQIRNEEKRLNQGSEWIKHPQMNKNKLKQKWKESSREELGVAPKKSHKWESSRIDKILNFWLHVPSKGHYKLVSLLSNIVEVPEKAPKRLSESKTYLLLKTIDWKGLTTIDQPHLENGKTIYQMITSLLIEKINVFMETNEGFHLEQKGCKRSNTNE